MRTPLLLLSLAWLAGSIPHAGAQTASASAGYVTLSLSATTTAARTNYFTPPLIPNAAFTGAATAVGDSTLTVATANWTTGKWAGTTPYYVYLKSGTQSGRVLRITANTGTNLTVDLTDDSAQSTALTLSGFAVAAGDKFEIVAGYTLATFFGSSAGSQVLTPGTSAANADSVSLWNWQLRRFDAYYFNSSSGTWIDATSGANANNVVIPPGALIAVTRQSGRAAVQFVQLGRVPQVAPLLKEPGGGFARYSSLRLPVDLQLSQIVLGSNWAKSNSAFTADTLSVFNDTTGLWEAYYQRTDNGWRKSGSANVQDTTVIPSGTAVVFLKRTAVSGAASFHSITLPYTP